MAEGNLSPPYSSRSNLKLRLIKLTPRDSRDPLRYFILETNLSFCLSMSLSFVPMEKENISFHRF